MQLETSQHSCGRGAVFAVGAVGLAFASFAGCGAGVSGPATYPVAGVVTFNGKPLEGAMITFMADGAGANATATSGVDGGYEAITFFDNGKRTAPGVTPGQYRVIVTKMEQPPPSSPDAPPKNIVPSKYGSVSSTPFSATITAGQQNRVPLDIQ